MEVFWIILDSGSPHYSVGNDLGGGSDVEGGCGVVRGEIARVCRVVYSPHANILLSRVNAGFVCVCGRSLGRC